MALKALLLPLATLLIAPSSVAFTSPSIAVSQIILEREGVSTTSLNMGFDFNRKKPDFIPDTVDDGGDFFDVFTGGGFGGEEDEAAAQIASKIRSVKDLGWTQPAKRAGNKRPRHRAWGGAGEKPLQEKPGYDESMDNCPEKWLSQEDFLARTKCPPGLAADAVFVALAGGACYAERDVVEKRLATWGSGRTFDEKAFLNDARKGRFELSLGWFLFVTGNVLSASCIAFPTNPFAKALEGALAGVVQAPPIDAM